MMTTMATSSTLLDGASVPDLAHMLAAGEPALGQAWEPCVWSPEKALAAAVLASAMIDIRDHAGDPKRAAAIAEDLAWVRAEDVQYLYAFRRVCELLNLDVGWVRGIVERWHAAGRRGRARLSWRAAA